MQLTDPITDKAELDDANEAEAHLRTQLFAGVSHGSPVADVAPGSGAASPTGYNIPGLAGIYTEDAAAAAAAEVHALPALQLPAAVAGATAAAAAARFAQMTVCVQRPQHADQQQGAAAAAATAAAAESGDCDDDDDVLSLSGVDNELEDGYEGYYADKYAGNLSAAAAMHAAAAAARAAPVTGPAAAVAAAANAGGEVAGSYRKNQQLPRMQLIRILRVLFQHATPAAGGVSARAKFDELHSRYNRSTRGLGLLYDECVKYLEFLLGPKAPADQQDNPAYAPWPKPEELKPEGLQLYLGRLLFWLNTGRLLQGAAAIEEWGEHARSCYEKRKSQWWLVEEALAGVLGVPCSSRLQLPLRPLHYGQQPQPQQAEPAAAPMMPQPVLQQPVLPADMPVQQQQQQQQAEPAAAPVMPQLVLPAAVPVQQQQQQEQVAPQQKKQKLQQLTSVKLQQQPAAPPAGRQASLMGSSSRASDGTGFRLPEYQSSAAAATLQRSQRYNLRNGTKRSYSSMAAGLE